jgi:HSP20 family protein
MTMDIIRWDPFKELSTLREQIDRLFDSFFGRVPSIAEKEVAWIPAINLEETDDSYVVQAELPGLKKDEIKVSITEDTVTISGERKISKEEKGKTYHRVEMSYGKFQRTLTLPGEIVPSKAKATYKDGILTIKLPKSEKAKVKEIEVEIK